MAATLILQTTTRIMSQPTLLTTHHPKEVHGSLGSFWQWWASLLQRNAWGPAMEHTEETTMGAGRVVVVGEEEGEEEERPPIMQVGTVAAATIMVVPILEGLEEPSLVFGAGQGLGV